VLKEIKKRVFRTFFNRNYFLSYKNYIFYLNAEQGLTHKNHFALPFFRFIFNLNFQEEEQGLTHKNHFALPLFLRG